MKNHVFRFQQLNEASELSKYGVPDEMVKAIHTMVKGEKETKPFTLQSGKRLDRGVSYKESPVSHDVKLVKTITKAKSYDKEILDYLDSIEPNTRCNLLLVSPDNSYFHYIMFKSESVQHATKGNQYRIITIDKDSKKPISKWAGTNGQLAGAAPIGTTLYVFEDEERSSEKQVKRKESKEITNEQFVKFVIENFNGILQKGFGKAAKGAKMKFYEKLSGLSPKDIIELFKKQSYGGHEFPTAKDNYPRPDITKGGKKTIQRYEKFMEIMNLAEMVERDIIDDEQIINEVDSFIEYMYKNDSVLSLSKSGEKSISEIIDQYSILGTATKFFQYVIYRKADLGARGGDISDFL